MTSLRIAFPIGLVLVSWGCFSPNQKIDSEASSGADESGGTSETGRGPGESSAGTETSGGTSGGPGTGTPTATGDGTTGAGDLTTSASETSLTDTSDPPPPGCGDGEVGDDEECDEGEDNGAGDCTELCTLPVCGDGIVSPDEACDDGEENGTDLDDCAPDCSKLVDAKTITLSYNFSTNGNMGGNAAIEHVDGRCEAAGLAGYKAMFADGTSRRASVSPFVGDGQVDWVLTPWTRYLRDDGELVWITDESALLGIRDGVPEPLLVPIASQLATSAYTGLQANWLAELNSDCVNWTTNSSGASHFGGEPDEVAIDRVLAGITPAISPGNCASSALVYCVQQ